MGPLAKKLLQQKHKNPNKVRKMKAAELVVSLTSGILGVISSWQNADGKVLRPQYAKFVGEFAVVVRELTAPSIDPKVSYISLIHTLVHIWPPYGRLMATVRTTDEVAVHPCASLVFTPVMNRLEIKVASRFAFQEMDKLQRRVMKLRDEMEQNNSPESLVVMSHLLVHIVDQLKDNGPARELWMYVFEDYFGLLKLSIKTRSHPVASMMKGLELRRTVSMVAGIKRMHRIGRAPQYRPPANQNIFTTRERTFVRPTAGKHIPKHHMYHAC
jgi:hypothetical protein